MIRRYKEQNGVKVDREFECPNRNVCKLAKICCPTYHRVCNTTAKCCEQCIEKYFCPLFPFHLK